jgi:hypothetical protein
MQLKTNGCAPSWLTGAVMLACLIFTTFNFSTVAAQSASNQTRTLQHVADWTTLAPTEFIGLTKQLPLFQLQTENGSVAYVVVADVNDRGLKFEPFFNKKTGTTTAAARSHNALAANNGGFFNLSDGESTSYVLIDGQNQCDPKTNKALIENPKLKPYLGVIFNRSELRILHDRDHRTRLEICKHNDPTPSGWKLESSIQGGPQLLPELTDAQEAFVRTSPDGTTSDSIGSRRLAARTACGITPDGHVMLLCLASKGQDEFSSGVTLAELAEILKQLGCDRAINFDGGTSTTLVICRRKGTVGQPDKSCKIEQVCGKHPEKLVKSGLLIKPLSL